MEYISIYFNTVHSKESSWDILNKQLAIHASFLLGALVLSVIDYLHVKSEAIHHSDWDYEK